MSTHKILQREVEQILNTDNVQLQHESFSILLQSISKFVEQVNKEKQLVKDISKRKKRLKELNKLIKKGESTEEDQMELQEVIELFQKAKSLKGKISDKLSVLKSLEGEVKALLYAIRKK